MIIIQSALQLILAALAAYWMSIAVSQKDGPYGVLRKAREVLPVIEETELTATVLATFLVILQVVFSSSWIMVAPFAFAGALVFVENSFGIKDYE